MDASKNIGNFARLSALVASINTGGGLHHLQEIIASYTKLDITTIAFILAFFGSISGALESFRSGAFKTYSWIAKFFTASISIAGNDRLNREILDWIGANILDRQKNRILTARTVSATNNAYLYGSGSVGSMSRRIALQQSTISLMGQEEPDKSMPIQYLPSFSATWFFHHRNLFLVKRVGSPVRQAPDGYQGVAEGIEPLVVTCFGRSLDPIKTFLETCRKFGEKQRETFTTIRSSQGVGSYSGDWGTTVLKPLRPLETVHFDETLKDDLIADMRKYLDPKTKKFYTSRGIPYRRGYLLHGVPGTGKTSLSTALAGLFGLDLYMIHLPSIGGDSQLVTMFSMLPARCIVLLEDIDAVGVERDRANRKPNKAEQMLLDSLNSSNVNGYSNPERSRCSLSGLLNVLDGVASQEGRIVIMTTNHPDKLDKALVRPGRIDKRVYLGYISSKSAELMFLRMYATDADSFLDIKFHGMELKALAEEFGNKLRDSSLTPAQVQGYLLNHIETPVTAVEGVSAWLSEEQARLEERRIKMMEQRKAKLAEVKKAMEEEAKKRLETTGSHLQSGNTYGRSAFSGSENEFMAGLQSMGIFGESGTLSSAGLQNMPELGQCESMHQQDVSRTAAGLRRMVEATMRRERLNGQGVDRNDERMFDGNDSTSALLGKMPVTASLGGKIADEKDGKSNGVEKVKMTVGDNQLRDGEVEAIA